MTRVRNFILFLLCLLVMFSPAQVFKSQQTKFYSQPADTVKLDSLSLVPGTVSFKINPENDSTLVPEINYKLHAIIFKANRPQSIAVTYKRFPYNFENDFHHKSQDDLYADLQRRRQPFEITYDNNQSAFSEYDGLNKNGNISRGISFGNNQDVVVNSNLNLQVSGKLTPEIDLVMAATDNNIPFQADGTTAQLQEFDKVFIQLNDQKSKMIVGDYQLSRPQNSYFMNFYKRAQGVYFENTFKDTLERSPLTFKTQVSGAVSKGKFSRQVFFGTENNQGPYRMKGADNEPFIIVLSGTEKIYIDGKLLQRGQENDYIIDYNTGEITFTARQIITKDKRIVAEFQYAERNYARSLFFFGEEISNAKTKVYFNIFSEQDNKNRPLQQNLDSLDKRLVMINIGDSLNQSYFPGETEQEFNTRDVFYRKTDSIVGSFVYPGVFVYTTVPDSINYTLKFSFVGQGKGNYNKISSAANGQVYQWFAPLDNILQGSYEPVIPLVTPKKNQMITAGFTHSFNADHALGIEGVYTKNDINTFSTKDKGNDEGAGVKINSRNQNVLKKDTTGKDLRLIYNLNYEFIQQRFRQVERFRGIEFDRDWNRPLTGILTNDQSLGGFELGLVKTKRASALYSYNFFDEGTSYRGKKHGLNASVQDQQSRLNYVGSFLQTNDPLMNQQTEFYRHKIGFSRTIDRIKFAYEDDFEQNLFSSPGTGSLLPRAYQFYEWEGSVSNADSSKNKVKVFYKRRTDKLNYGNELKDSTSAQNIGLQASVYSIKNNPFSVLITYRKLDLQNVVGTSLRPDNTLLNRLEYNPRYFKGFITAGLFYETGYGLENRRDYYYLEVAPGQGQFAWNDYNSNGIRERNEFEVALYPDQQRFIRIYTPTNDYYKVLQNQLSVSATVRPSMLMKSNKKAFGKFIGRWSFQSAVRLDNKISDNRSFENYNPFNSPNDTLLLASNNNIRHSVFFNQASAIFGADYTYTDNRSRQLLTNGLEEKALFSRQLRWRLNFLKAWAINSDNMISRKGNDSRFFPERTYSILSYMTEQKLVFQPNTIFRLSTIFKYETKENMITDNPQRAYLTTYGFEMKYNQTQKGSLTGRIDMVKIKYNSDLNSALSYEMLNGLSTGDNFTWEFSYQRNLSNNIQISINYNGRKTPATPAVHIGGAQVRAYF